MPTDTAHVHTQMLGPSTSFADLKCSWGVVGGEGEGEGGGGGKCRSLQACPLMVYHLCSPLDHLQGKAG
jgi:hypothetical protein